MKFEAIIFDLDGVICHTDQYHYKAWKQIADEKNIYFDESINNRLRGVSRMESLDIILERYEGIITDDEKQLIATRKNDIYLQLLQDMDQNDLTIEVRETLKKLRRMGFLLAIGSSSKNAGFILDRLGLGNYFDAVSDGTNIEKSKPDPEVFLKAAQYISCQPAECLVVEDAKAGIDAARQGGFKSAGLGEAYDYSKTDYPISEFQQLLRIVD